VCTIVGVSVDSRAIMTKRVVLQVRLWNWGIPVQYGLFNLIFSAAEKSTQGDGSVGYAVAAAGGGGGGGT
jgi:hypothetical protein